MEKARSFGRSRSLGSGMKRFPFTSAPDPPELTDDDGFRWSTDVSRQRASPPRLAPSDKDTTERISSPTLPIGARTPPTSPPRTKKKPGRTKRTLNALALLDGGKHGGRSSTPDAPGYGEVVAEPNIARYEADQMIAAKDKSGANGNGKPIRTLKIPTAGQPKKGGEDDRSVLTDEMSNLHEHVLSKQRMAGMQADDDVSALSMGTAGREFYGWDAEGTAKSGAFGLGKKMSPSRLKKNHGLKKTKSRGTASPMAVLGAISESNEMAPENPTASSELKAWDSAVESTPPITNRKQSTVANHGAEDDLISPSAAASSRSMSPRYKKTGNSNGGTTSPSRSSPKARVSRISAHSSGELLCLNERAFSAESNFADDDENAKGRPTVAVLADVVADPKVGRPLREGGRRSPLSTKGEIHDDVTMVRTNSQGHLARTSPESLGPPKVGRYSQAVGSFDQSTDVATERKEKDAKSPLYIIASYDSNDNSLLQRRLSFPPASNMVTEGTIALNSSGGTPPRPSSGDEYIDAYQQAVSKYNSKLTPASPARSTKSSTTAETAALSRTSTPASSSPAGSGSKPIPTSNGKSSTGDKKSNSSLRGTGLKKLVRMPSLRKSRSMGRSVSLKAMFSNTKPTVIQDNLDFSSGVNGMGKAESGGEIDFIAFSDIAGELAKRSPHTNEERFEQNDTNDSYGSLEDDDYTEDFNVVKEIMENKAAGQTKIRADTFDTGYTDYTSDTFPSKTNDVGTAIADLFCFIPLNALDDLCLPTAVKGTTGREPQTPMSETASYFAVNNDQVGKVPPMPSFGEHRQS